jgi:thiamine biosynthesis lipoprotein
MLKIQFRAMGCEISAFVDNEGAESARALAAVPGWFETWEQALSRFRPDSALSQLNREPRSWAQTDPLLLEVLQTALWAAEWTDGLVTPDVLEQVEQAGYRRSFEQLSADTTESQQDVSMLGLLPIAERQERWKLIQLHPAAGAVRRPVGMRIDLGGVGKGWAAWQAARLLERFGPALVDAGGDIAVSGARADGSFWPVAVADPLGVQENLGLLDLGRCGVATSGIDYRQWRRNGRLMHHIIDPRSGEPAETDLLSVSVIAPDVQKAEAAAKAVLILGSQVGPDWLQDHAELSALLVGQDGRLTYSGDFEQYLWRTSEHVF